MLHFRRKAITSAVFAALGPALACANPIGGQVVRGAAAFQRDGATLTVNQATDRAVVNWQGFSIGASEVTRFVQPGASAAILSRVVSGNPSALLGQLQANGKVFLVNPNGIVVGGGAVIDTNGFVASTLDVPNAQFMAGGDLAFSGASTAAVQNLGAIHAHDGDVYLIGYSVENSGLIEAPRGTAGLAAGTDVILRHAGDERLFVQASLAAAPPADAGVRNTGTLSAVQAELRAAGGNVYALAVNNSGVIRATGIAEKDGHVVLASAGGNVETSGTITARNADGDGGRAVLTGNRVAVAATAAIDVSADPNGGNGGFVETSGRAVRVDAGARITAGAANGTAGQWLIDPFNVRIVDVFTGTSNGVFVGGTFTPTGNDATIDAGTIQTALTNGTDVTVTTSNPAGRQEGNITVDAAIFPNTPASNPSVPTLTLNADNQIVFNASIQAQAGSRGLNLIAFANGLSTAAASPAIIVNPSSSLSFIRNGTFNANTGGIRIDGTLNSLTSGNVAADRWRITAAGDITGASTGSVQAFNVALNSTAGAINYAGRLGADLLTASAAGAIAITNTTGVNITNLGTTSAGGALNIRNTGSGGSTLTIVGAVSTTGGNPLTLSNVGRLYIDSTNAFGRGTGTVTDTNGTVTLTARGIADGATPRSPSIDAARLALSSTTGGSGIGSAANPIDTSISNLEALTQTGGVFITNTGKELTIGGVPTFAVGGVLTPNNTNGGPIRIVNDRGLFVTDATAERAHVAGPQDIVLQATGNTSDIVLADNSPNAVNAHGGSVTLSAGRDVVVGAFGRSGDVSGSRVDLNAGHAVILDEASTVTGGAGGIGVTAGTVNAPPDARATIVAFMQSSASGTRLVTTGAPIDLTTAAGGSIDIASGSTVAIDSGGGTVNFRTDDIRVASLVNAPDGFVQFLPASANRAFDVGSESAGRFSLTDGELNSLMTGTVVIGDAAKRTDVAVTAPISATTYNALGIQAAGGSGNMIASSVTVPSIEIQASDSINGTATVNARDRLTLTSDAGSIQLSGPVITNALLVPNTGFLSLESLANRIDLLGDIQRRGPVTVRNTVPLTIHGLIGGTNAQNDVTIRTVGDITMNARGAAGFSGARVVSTGSGNTITLEATDGHFINVAGSGAIAPSAGARFRVYSQDRNTPFNPGGLVGDLYQASAVSFPTDPDAPANVFYFQSIPAQQPVAAAPASPQIAALSTSIISRFVAVSLGESLIDFKARLEGLSMMELRALWRAENVEADVDKVLAFDVAFAKAGGVPLYQALTEEQQQQMVQSAIREQREINARRIVQAKLAAFRAILAPTPFTPQLENALLGRNLLNAISLAHYVNPLSLTLDQIATLDRAELLRLAAAAGAPLGASERKVAAGARVTPDQLNALVRAGGGQLTSGQLSAIVASGGGNLTIAQIVASGAGNVISNDGASFGVIDRAGTLITNDGGSLTVNQLASLITNDGASLITNDGGSLITNDGGSLITNDGGSLITNDGGSLITNDGGSLVSNVVSLINRDAASLLSVDRLIGNDGASLIGNGSALISGNGSALISGNGSALISGNGSALISGNGSAIISGNGSALISGNGSALISGNGSALIGTPTFGSNLVHIGP